MSEPDLPTPVRQDSSRLTRATAWIHRRRNAVLSSALRGASYAAGGGIVGFGFWWLQHQL
ncbi:hypothetical protein ACIQAC_05115 [Streptomyces sp. NPDC088387]|uniref:hypothetical protein n=1 Tax=Streptomyces sp. NPDC088387 TaxID=3365859 RepID=UPI00382A474F